MNKFSVELIKCDVFCWLVGSGTPFGKTLLPEFCHIFKPISGYTGLIRQTFNTILDEDYADFTICVGTTLLECEDCYLGMRFVDVIMTCLMDLMAKITLVPLEVLSITYI